MMRRDDAGTDVNAQDNNGMTALMHAVLKGQIDRVKALLAAGAAVNVQDTNGGTALMLAAFKGDRQSIMALIAAVRMHKRRISGVSRR